MTWAQCCHLVLSVFALGVLVRQGRVFMQCLRGRIALLCQGLSRHEESGHDLAKLRDRYDGAGSALDRERHLNRIGASAASG